MNVSFTGLHNLETPENVYRMSVVDKNYNILSEVGIIDKDDMKRNHPDASYTLCAGVAFNTLAHDMPDLTGGKKSDSSFDIQA